MPIPGWSRNKEDFEKPELIDKFIQICKDAGHIVIITCTSRTYKVQAALFAQGRERLVDVNRLRRAAGMYIIDEKENKKIVTWTMNSKHIVNPDDERTDNNKARAFDFCIVIDGKEDWNVKADVNNDGISDYRECGLLGESLGLISGQRFKTPDWPHLELP